MNHDGYDDLLVGQRTGEVVDIATGYSDIWDWGPAQLYLGSPTGIQTEPLWTLFAPVDFVAGAGRGVAALPDEGVVVVTVVAEGLFYGDHSPEFLGVIRDAGTPDAYFDEVVLVPEITPGGFTPYLLGWMDDGTGQQALAMGEFSGSTGVQWFPWFADGSGFHPDGDGVAVPSAWWAPPSDQALDGSLSALSFSVGRHNQAILLGLDTETGYQLLEWGRPPGQLGIPVQGVTAEGCTFTVAGVVPPDSVAPPKPEPEGCGCDSAGGPGWLAGFVGLLGRIPRRRSGRLPAHDAGADLTADGGRPAEGSGCARP